MTMPKGRENEYTFFLTWAGVGGIPSTFSTFTSNPEEITSPREVYPIEYGMIFKDSFIWLGRSRTVAVLTIFKSLPNSLFLKVIFGEVYSGLSRTLIPLLFPPNCRQLVILPE